MDAAQEMLFLDKLPLAPARCLLIQQDGSLYAGRHYGIHRSDDDGRTWRFVTAMPRSTIRRMAEFSRLGCRLLRHEVKAMNVLSDGSVVASNRESIYRAGPNERVMQRSRVDEGGLPASPPMTITVGPNDRVVWGEYNSRTKHGRPVRLFVSDDGGRTYEVAHVFEGGSIIHVHNIAYDEKLDQYWVLTGDYDPEPGIGCLSGDLKHFSWLVKGQQCYRAVEVFDFGDHLIYATDSHMAANAVMRLEKKSGRIERLQGMPGSCIYACRFGGLLAVTTTVEPSPVNFSRLATLWLSRDGEHWRQGLTAPKDRWSHVYFQFGSLVLPRGASGRETLFFSGQALAGVDGRAFAATLSKGVEL